MNTSEKYNAISDCLVEDMDGELLVYHPSTAATVHLNGPSSVVWKLCDGQNTVQAIIDLLLETYPGQAEQIPGDVADVIKELLENKIIESVPASEVS